ncbi:GPW/gp25 family protein [bacterium]|jgi:phage baseplate assembly protein W|nr:GPW/gp25 family protein [bacterium]
MTVVVKTPVSKRPTLYADFKKDLQISPVSQDLTVNKDEAAVKEAIRNLLLTDPGERPMQPFLGGGIRALLFENVTPGTLKLIEEKVKNTIKNYEPRAELIDVLVSSIIDDNTVSVRVTFYIKNTSAPIQLDVILERIR